MNFVFLPWQLLLVILAGWLTRQQEAAVELRALRSVKVSNRRLTPPAKAMPALRA